MKSIPMAAALLLSSPLGTAQAPAVEGPDVAAFDEAAAAAAMAARGRAADALDDALESYDEIGADEGEVALEALRSGLRAAAAELGEGSQAASRLRDLAAGSDVAALERAVERAIGDLRFEPLAESPMPVGFPPRAPVGEVVLKSYPLYRMAQVPMRGETSAFWKLFGHIKSADIAMTAPVQMDAARDADRDRVDPTRMAFLYRKPDMGVPGENGAVEVVDIPAHLTVSIGSRGYRNARSVDARTDALEGWLADHAGEFEACGPVRIMGHNSPMVPASRRFFEVEIPVRRIAQ